MVDFLAKEDPFAVTVTKGELFIALAAFQKKIPQFAWCFYDKVGSILCLWIQCSTAMCLAFSTCRAKIYGEKIFAGTNFRDLAFDRENHENFCLTKISRYTV